MRVNDEKEISSTYYEVKLQSELSVCSLTFECIIQQMRYEMSRCYPTCRCSLCVVVAIRKKKKKESNHIPWQDIKKKLKDITNSLSEGSLKNSERTNERTIFGWEKRRDNLCHAKVAASTENDNNYNSIRVLCIPEEEKTLSISYFSNRYIQRNAFL
jgi:hypothetical protein